MKLFRLRKTKSHSTAKGGYVGLIVILLSVSIMAFLYTKLYLTPRDRSSSPQSEFQPETASGTAPQTEYQAMHADVDAATAIQTKLNAHNTETNALINE